MVHDRSTLQYPNDMYAHDFLTLKQEERGGDSEASCYGIMKEGFHFCRIMLDQLP